VPKKKLVTEEESTEENPPSMKEPTIKVKALTTFKDGGLREYFEQCNLPLEWRAQEVREIPIFLYNMCIASGGRFELVV